MEELKDAVEYLRTRECRTNSDNGVKFIAVKKMEAETLLEQFESEALNK